MTTTYYRRFNADAVTTTQYILLEDSDADGHNNILQIDSMLMVTTTY